MSTKAADTCQFYEKNSDFEDLLNNIADRAIKCKTSLLYCVDS